MTLMYMYMKRMYCKKEVFMCMIVLYMKCTRTFADVSSVGLWQWLFSLTPWLRSMGPCNVVQSCTSHVSQNKRDDVQYVYSTSFAISELFLASLVGSVYVHQCQWHIQFTQDKKGECNFDEVTLEHYCCARRVPQ